MVQVIITICTVAVVAELAIGKAVTIPERKPQGGAEHQKSAQDVLTTNTGVPEDLPTSLRPGQNHPPSQMGLFRQLSTLCSNVGF